ncbi:unnamed protein product [Musa textilis]
MTTSDLTLAAKFAGRRAGVGRRPRAPHRDPIDPEAGAAVRGAWERRGKWAEQGNGWSAKLGNQIAIASTMVGMVCAQLYVSLMAHG